MSQRSYTMHIVQNAQCTKTFQLSLYTSVLQQGLVPIHKESSMETIEFVDGNSELYNQFIKHEESGYSQIICDPGRYHAGIELLQILRNAKSPLYLFDEIISWTQRATIHYNVKFDEDFLSRDKMIDIIQNRFGLKGLNPLSEKIYLKGCKSHVTLVFHDFQQCMYSILTDPELMKEENLLLGPNNDLQYEPQERLDILNDVNTGSCFCSAYKTYIRNPEDLLCPIIFFIDKTHTDINGRLCLEPLQFTLGIFNRTVRSHPKSWRTLGYVNDLQTRYSGKGQEKMQDYHLMLQVLLKSFSKAQKEPIIWEMKRNGVSKFVRLKIPVMFVIGDTEGHDKLCGRYSCRANSKSLCRYCNIPFHRTDDPFFGYRHTKVNLVKRLILKNEVKKLQEMSMHCIENAWHKIEFCDEERGIHGATLAELLHCIQQGIFEYAIKALFEQKKKKKLSAKEKEILNEGKKRKRNEDHDEEESDIEESDIEVSVIEESYYNDNSESDSEDGSINEDDEIEDTSCSIDETTESSSFETEHTSVQSSSSITLDSNFVESKFFSFSKTYLDFFDELCRRYGRYLQHQSDRDLPKTLFNGIMSL